MSHNVLEERCVRSFGWRRVARLLVGIGPLLQQGLFLLRCPIAQTLRSAHSSIGLEYPQYTTQKSKKNTPERIEMKKYNKYLRRHTLHREIK